MCVCTGDVPVVLRTRRALGSRDLKWNSTDPEVRACHRARRMNAPRRVKVTAEGSLAVAASTPVDTAFTLPWIRTYAGVGLYSVTSRKLMSVGSDAPDNIIYTITQWWLVSGCVYFYSA